MALDRIYIGSNKIDLDTAIIFCHDNATANEKKGYRDPYTGNYVFTSTSLKIKVFAAKINVGITHGLQKSNFH